MADTYQYGHRSQQQLETCHPDLQLIAALALKWSRVDITIVEGHRGVVRQQELFKDGLTLIDGITRMGKHNIYPAEALDFCAWVPERKSLCYDKIHLAYIAALFVAAAQVLYDAGKITHLIRWGGNWDRDGMLVFDHRLQDLPHVELYIPRPE